MFFVKVIVALFLGFILNVVGGGRDGLGVLATLPCVVVGPGTIFFY